MAEPFGEAVRPGVGGDTGFAEAEAVFAGFEERWRAGNKASDEVVSGAFAVGGGGRRGRGIAALGGK